MSGRLIYINPLEDYGKSNTNDIIYPYEDYSMAVDLIVKIGNRYSCGYETDKEKRILKFSSSNGSLSFLGGSDGDNKTNFLTTKYTDVSFSSPLSNTNECLGIESINITYNSWMYPQVTIKFIDVRGASIMAPAEANLNNNGSEESNNNEFFKSFFTFPYPMFELKVKGFYGKGVTYTLAVQKTNIDFDSQNGSFIFTVNFIGYMYGILADFPITYAAMAPYMEGGKEYWEREKQKRFKFKNRDGSDGIPFYTLPELKSKISKLLPNSDNILQTETDEEQCDTIKNNDDKVDNLNTIKEYYIFNSNEWSRLKEDNTNGYFFYKIVDADYDISVELKNLSEFIKSHSQYDNDDFKCAWNPPYVENGTFNSGAPIGHVYDLYLEINGSSYYYVPYERSFLTLNGNRGKSYVGETLYNDHSSEFKTIANKHKNISLCSSYNNNIMSVIPTIAKRIYIIPDGIFTENYKKIDKEIEKLSASSNKLINEIRRKEEENKEITRILGFNPSIKNIYNLIFAHVETFMYCFFSQTLNIKKQLDSTKRNIFNYGLNASLTDIPNNMTKLPPYFGCYEKNGSDIMRYKWAGDLVGGETLEEVKFIHQLLNATELYFKDEVNLNSNSEEGASDNINVNNYFIPITKYDIYINNNKNPYDNVTKSLKNGKIVDLLTTFFIRCVHFYSSINGTASKNLIEAFTSIEVYNFIKATENIFITSKEDIIKKIKTSLNTVLTNYIYIIKDKNNKLLFDGRFIKPNFGEDIKSFPIGVYDSLNIDGKNTSIEGDYIPHKFNGEKYKTIKIFNIDDLDKSYENIPNLLQQYELEFNNEINNEFKDNYLGKKLTDNDILDIIDKKYIYGTNDGITKETFIKRITMVECFATNKKHSLCKVLNENIGNKKVLNTTDKYAKAFLFLASIPIVSKDKRKDYKINFYGTSLSDNKTGFYPKLMLLKEGAHYWKRDITDNNIFKPGEGVFIPDNNKALTASGDDFNGIHFFRKLGENASRGHNEYIEIEEPNKSFGTNRVEVLKNYFISWVDTEYKLYDDLLNDKNLYNKTDNGIDNELKNDINDIFLIEKRDNLQDFLKRTLFDTCFLVNTFDNITPDPGKQESIFNYTTDNIKEIIEGFRDKTLSVIKKMTQNKTVSLTSEDKNENVLIKNDLIKDAKLSTYLTLKMLYDKWLCSANGYNNWCLDNKNSIFETFRYIDTYYNDIGNLLNVNIEKISAFLYNAIPSISHDGGNTSLVQTSLTIYDFLIRVAEDCGGMLLVLPNKLENNRNETEVKRMFKPHSLYDAFDDSNSTFIFMYTYKPSEHLGDANTDINGWKSDGLDLEEDNMNLFMLNNGYTIPAFSVPFAQQNQSIFKNIRLNTESAGLTEPAISATFQIAAKGSETPRHTMVYGQDIYKLFSTYSYKCEVSCMGNMEIMPMMLFQLNNIPMWRGAYQIVKVSHNITAGNIDTSFEGLRMNKNAIPFLDAALIMGNIDKNTINQNNGYNGGQSANNQNNEHNANNSSNTGNINNNTSLPMKVINEKGKHVVLNIKHACYGRDDLKDCFALSNREIVINNGDEYTSNKEHVIQLMYGVTERKTFKKGNRAETVRCVKNYYYSGNTAEEICKNYENAVNCIKDHIDEGVIIMVGVNYKSIKKYNADLTSDHFINIYGYKVDGDIVYFYYTENGRSQGNGCKDETNILTYNKGKVGGNGNFIVEPKIYDDVTKHLTKTIYFANNKNNGHYAKVFDVKYDVTHIRPSRKLTKYYISNNLKSGTQGTFKYNPLIENIDYANGVIIQ